MSLDFKKVLQKPLVAREDMNPEMSAECVEIVASAVDKYLVAENYEKAAQTAKESLERKFGPTWNVCVGEGFGYDVTYNAKHCLLIYYGAWAGAGCPPAGGAEGCSFPNAWGARQNAPPFAMGVLPALFSLCLERVGQNAPHSHLRHTPCPPPRALAQAKSWAFSFSKRNALQME